MTLTQALATVKKLSAEIQDDTLRAIYLGIIKGSDKKPVAAQFKTSEEEAKRITSDYQSLTDKMKRRTALKVAITQKNFETKVELGGKEVTIIEAIEVKNSIFLKETLLTTMETHLTTISKSMAQHRQQLDTQIQTAVNSSYGGAGRKPTEDEFNAIAAPQKKMFEAFLNDPLKLSEKIETLREEIREVKHELDFRLGTVNATTTIEVNY